MKKYIFFLMGAVCFLLSSSAVHANELNKSDANIIGHVLDKNTEVWGIERSVFYWSVKMGGRL